MKFAITHPLVTHPYHPDLVSGAGVTRLAQAAEAAGFHGYGFTDHPAPTDRWLNAGGHDALDPFVALGFAAAVTETLRLIPNIVVLPYRNPFVVAKAAATLDMLSGGRFTLAVGAGYLKGEFAALGRRPRRAQRARRRGARRGAGDLDGRRRHRRGPPLLGPRASPPTRGRSRSRTRRSGSVATAARARQRVADHAQGWCPFPAAGDRRDHCPHGDRSTPASSWPRRSTTSAGGLDAADRDPASVDVAFSNPAGGDPSSDAFDADAHLQGLAELADARRHLGAGRRCPATRVEHADRGRRSATASSSIAASHADDAASILLVAGPPGAGKSTVAALRGGPVRALGAPAHRRLLRVDRQGLRRAVAGGVLRAERADRLRRGGRGRPVRRGRLRRHRRRRPRHVGARPVARPRTVRSPTPLLLPDATVARQRAADRGEHPLKDLDVVDQMHAAFVAHLDGYERHVIDSTSINADDTAAEIARRLDAGDLLLR